MKTWPQPPKVEFMGVEIPQPSEPRVIPLFVKSETKEEDDIVYTIRYPDGTLHEQKWVSCPCGTTEFRQYRTWKTKGPAERELKKILAKGPPDANNEN